MHPARLALAACTFAASAAQASQCALDQVPGATLLVPYFEVDLAGCNAQPPSSGRTTVFWVRNVSETHQLAQVTLWGDYGIPAAGFTIYLPPLAARHIDLADVICRGRLPSTGAAVSPRSEFGLGNAPNFPGCNGGTDPSQGLPVANQFSPAFTADVQIRLTGNRSPTTNTCFGSRQGDSVARGYLTVDAVTACTAMTALDPGYPTILGFDNALVGGYKFVEPANNFAQGGAAIALEAAPPGFYAPGDWTFYGRYFGWTAVDRREPLPSTWSVPFVRGDIAGRRTDLIVWRETPRINPTPSSCNFPPPPLPLHDFGQAVFDAGGQSASPPVLFPGEVPPSDAPIGFATQKIDPIDIETSSPFGASVFDGTIVLNLQYPPLASPGPMGQAWVGAAQYAEGRFSDIAPGTALDSMCGFGKASPANVAGPQALEPNTRYFIFSNGLEP
jgi:hypothetical protein